MTADPDRTGAQSWCTGVLFRQSNWEDAEELSSSVVPFFGFVRSGRGQGRGRLFLGRSDQGGRSERIIFLR